MILQVDFPTVTAARPTKSFEAMPTFIKEMSTIDLYLVAGDCFDVARNHPFVIIGFGGSAI
jgi:hypothetical protein